MSGASALAAAKRRRGMSNTPPPRPGGQQGMNRAPPPQGRPATGIPSPMQLLENHHMRIAILEKDVNKTREDIALVENKEPTVEPNNENLVKQIMQLEAKIAILEEKYGTEEEPVEDIAYFKNKMKELELQMAELKQHVLKIQTFAMETNLALMKERQQQQADNEIDDNSVIVESHEGSDNEDSSNEETGEAES